MRATHATHAAHGSLKRTHVLASWDFGPDWFDLVWFHWLKTDNNWPRQGWPHRGFAWSRIVQCEGTQNPVPDANQHRLYHRVWLVWFQLLKMLQRSFGEDTESLGVVCSMWKDASSIPTMPSFCSFLLRWAGFRHLRICLIALKSICLCGLDRALFYYFYVFLFDNQIMRRAGLSLWPTINKKYFLVKSELNSKTFPQAAFSMCTLGVCCALWSAVITDRSKVINWPSDSRVHSVVWRAFPSFISPVTISNSQLPQSPTLSM